MSYACKSLIVTDGEIALREKRLSICLGADGFSFSETGAGGLLLTFGIAEGAHASTMTGVMADVKAFLAQAGIRPLGYAAMELTVLSDESVWVPDELYSPTSVRQYLRLEGSTPDGVLTCHCQQLASTAVFAGNEHVVTAFKVALPGVQVMHQHAKLAQLAPLSATHPCLVAHWRKGRIDVAALRDGRYVFGNTLSFNNDSEALFHLVEVMRSCDMEQPDTELMLCGDVDREQYALLRPYFPKVTLWGGTFTQFRNPEFRRLHTYRYALILM